MVLEAGSANSRSCQPKTSSSLRSAQASHLGNISYVEKRRLNFDPIREEIMPL
ncbi:MAG: hypothetical protein ACE141_09500 [Bryobacteraceae bacterium]